MDNYDVCLVAENMNRRLVEVEALLGIFIMGYGSLSTTKSFITTDRI